MSAGLSALNCDLRSYSRLWLGEFIELYQQEECLWHPKHQDYSNHSVRNKAYDRLVEKLKEVEPNPDRAMVVRKINSLRSAFRREFRKSNTKAAYETRLWYYDKLLFIAEQNPKRPIALRDTKTPKRSLAISFDVDDSMEFEEDHAAEQTTNVSHTESLNHSAQSSEKIATDECVIVKDELQHTPHSQQHHQHQEIHQQQTHEQHHHQQQQQHEIQHHQQHSDEQQHLQHATANAQPQHTTEVKVLEITSLDTNSQREIQQAVNSLEHQQHLQHQLHHQHQHQQSNHGGPQIAQIHQQVPTIQIAREHLQPLFGNSYTTATASQDRQQDEYDAIGINVASKLRVMNPTQRIIAEKLISDVLFNGQLDNLSVTSTLAQ